MSKGKLQSTIQQQGNFDKDRDLYVFPSQNENNVLHKISQRGEGTSHDLDPGSYVCRVLLDHHGDDQYIDSSFPGKFSYPYAFTIESQKTTELIADFAKPVKEKVEKKPKKSNEKKIVLQPEESVTSFTLNNVCQNHTIKVFFAPNTYTISAIVVGKGVVVPAVTTVQHGKDVIFSVSADSGYKIEKIIIDEQAISGSKS